MHLPCTVAHRYSYGTTDMPKSQGCVVIRCTGDFFGDFNHRTPVLRFESTPVHRSDSVIFETPITENLPIIDHRLASAPGAFATKEGFFFFLLITGVIKVTDAIR